MRKIFITTAIDYVNAYPHAGHALEKIQADVISRYHRNLGDRVFFLTGTDENSLKNVQSAEKENISVTELVERNAKQFAQLRDILNLSNDDFIRTTEPRHIKGVQKLWQACQKDIYKRIYQGLYCVGCEEFYKESELINGLCPEHKTKPELVKEENYFFRLSNYQEKLKKLIETDELEIIPQARKNEVLSFINSGLEDICISRSSDRAHHWGIDVPNDPSQKIWVWFDALSNYINALGYANNTSQFQEWWQDNNDILHIIGKGILRFHAVYWPAILLAAGLNLPNKIFVHGYLTVEGEKMAKSLGNVINPLDLVSKYGEEVVRYFFIREFSCFEDGNFSEFRIRERYNSDLAQGLGNLLSRILALGEKYGKSIPLTKNSLRSEIQEIEKAYHQSFSDFRLNDALAKVWDLINILNKFITDHKPWETLTKDENQFKEDLSTLILSLGKSAFLLSPVMPKTSDKILDFLSLEGQKEQDWNHLQVSLQKQESLFPVLD
jgi:methionyl-tRNA synthetase